MQGAMGHSLSISLGLALNCPDKKFLCLIGDAALLIKLGSLATIIDKKNVDRILILKKINKDVMKEAFENSRTSNIPVKLIEKGVYKLLC